MATDLFDSSGDAIEERQEYQNKPFKVLSCGRTVPTDATAGYAKGCLFLHLDGGSADVLYVNTGTTASCDFDNIGIMAGYKARGTSTNKWDFSARDPDNTLIVFPTDNTHITSGKPLGRIAVAIGANHSIAYIPVYCA